MIFELLWCQFSSFLNLLKAESWLYHSFRHCITIFISSLKQIHDTSLLLRMKYFVNASVVCSLSEFNQSVLVFKRSVQIFSLWLIWVFFCDVYWSDLFFVSDENSNSIWVEIILCIEFCAYHKACRSVVVCMNCTLFDLL